MHVLRVTHVPLCFQQYPVKAQRKHGLALYMQVGVHHTTCHITTVC